jgi:hypothetical protein
MEAQLFAPLDGLVKRWRYSVPLLIGLCMMMTLVGYIVQARSEGALPPQLSYHATVAPAYRLLWARSLDANVDSAPVVATIRMTHGMWRTVVFVLAGNNDSNCNPSDPVRVATTYAFNAANGRLIWQRSTSGPARCTTAGPVVSQGWVYSVGLDGRIHRYAAATGQEYQRNGWPQPYTRMPYVEKVSATPTIAHSYLYVTTSGFIGDQGHYEGHLVTINLRTGRRHVFNTLCSNIHTLLSPRAGSPTYCPYVRSGLFGRGEGVVDPITHDVYIVSGNGPWNGHTNWGDSVLKLSPDGSRLRDSYTPTDQAYLDDNDLDLGSTGPAILPTVQIRGRPYHLLVQGGKGPLNPGSGPVVLRLLNRDNLSGKGEPGHLGGDLQDLDAPGGCEVLNAPAVWTDRQRHIWVFYASDCGLAGYRLQTSGSGAPRLTLAWEIDIKTTTPIIAANVLYVAHSGAVEARDPVSGHLLWSSADRSAGGSIGNLHWEYPTVSHDLLFMTDESAKLYAYRRR